MESNSDIVGLILTIIKTHAFTWVAGSGIAARGGTACGGSITWVAGGGTAGSGGIANNETTIIFATLWLSFMDFFARLSTELARHRLWLFWP